MPHFTIAVMADTHVRTEPHDPQACYPSDARMNARCRQAVAMARARDPAFAIHLGDVTHTLPILAAHEPTQRAAKRLLEALGCTLYVAPGNHDVGDKPSSRATAARADERAHALFESIWGPPWQAFDHDGCRFVTLDAPIMDTGGALEAEQWAWLERTLAQADRSFVFLHYPPFLLHPDEPAHYDNLGLRARTRLLALLERHRVEALFAGHVHNFFHHHHQHTQHWLLPSTAFVRPEYSELFPVPPLAENGRDDPDKLGFFLVHVDEVGHRVEWVCPARTHGEHAEPPVPASVGVWLRGGWCRTVDLPAGDLDPFGRKRARNDWSELALRDLGLRRLRVQLADLDDPETGPRLRHLQPRGCVLHVATVGAPSQAQIATLAKHRDIITAWEAVLPPDLPPAAVAALAASPVPVALSVVDPGDVGLGGYFCHFPEQGFPTGSALPSICEDLPNTIRWLTFRIPHDLDVWAGIQAAEALAAARGLEALCHVELPRGTELHPPTDPHQASRRVATALLAAAASPSAQIWIDGLLDKDRGYHPRPGLLDRRCNPNPCACVLRTLTRALGVSPPPERLDENRFGLGERELWLEPRGPGPWLSLEHDRPQDQAPRGPAISVASRRSTR